MAYFENFPRIKYDFTARGDINPIVEVIQDTTTKINMFITNEDLENLCFRYTIKVGELPEHISQNYYKTPELAWTILFVNSIGNLNNEWPLTDLKLIDYVSKIYGVSNINAVHHYEKLPENIAMDSQFVIDNYGINALNTVTNLDYETSLNEYKRMIYVIKKEYINTFTKQYLNLLV